MLEAEDRTTEALLTWLPSIRKAPYQYDFHTVLRCLECAYNRAPRLGESTKPKDDLVRLSQQPFLHCPNSAIHNFQPKVKKKPAQLSSYLFGLFGPNGPLPIHITEYIRQRSLQEKDTTASAFLNLFHHRLLSYYYRAWADSEPVTHLDRHSSSNILNTIIHSLSGAHTDKKNPKNNKKIGDFNDLEQYYYAGHLSAKHRPAEGLASILSHYFKCQFTIDQFTPRWVNIPKQDQTCLSRTLSTTKQLGYNMMLGKKVLSAQQQINIVMYSNTFKRFTDFLPNQKKDLNSLINIIKRYLGSTFEWQLIIKIKSDQVPQWQLGQTTHLGWTLWLTTPKLITQRLLNSKQTTQEKHIDIVLNPMRYRRYKYRDTISNTQKNQTKKFHSN